MISYTGSFKHSLRLLFLSLVFLFPFSGSYSAPTLSPTPIPEAELNALDDGFRYVDDDLPASFEIYDQAARVFAKEQQEISLLAIYAAAKLEERKYTELVPEMGKKRIQEIKSALELPEDNLLQRSSKKMRLKQLKFQEFAGMDLDSEAAQMFAGEIAYVEQVFQGGQAAENLGLYINGIGKVHPTQIDGKVYPRIVHEESGLAIFIADGKTDLNSPHWKRVIARTRLQSMKGKGRPILILAVDHEQIEIEKGTGAIRYQFFNKAKKSAEWGTNWKQKLSEVKDNAKLWWQANFVMPDKGAAVLAALGTTFQIGTVEGVNYLNHFLTGQPLNHNAAILTAGYASVLGLFSSFYNNATTALDPNDPVARRNSMWIRTLSTSATFGYTLQIMNHGISSLSVLTVGGWVHHIGLWANFLASSAAGDNTTKAIADIRADMGLSRGEVNLFGTKIKRTQVEYQFLSAGPRFLKTADLVHMGVSVGGMNLPLGTTIFYSGIVGGQYIVMKYAESIGYKDAPKLRGRWETFWGPYFRRLNDIYVTGMAIGPAGDPFATLGSIIGKSALETVETIDDYFSNTLLISAKDKLLAWKSQVGNACNYLWSGKPLPKFAEPESAPRSPPPFKPTLDGEWMEINL